MKVRRGLLSTAAICLPGGQSGSAAAPAAADGDKAGTRCFDIPRWSEGCYSGGSQGLGIGDGQPTVHSHRSNLCGTLPIQPCCHVSQLRASCRGAALRARPDNPGETVWRFHDWGFLHHFLIWLVVRPFWQIVLMFPVCSGFRPAEQRHKPCLCVSC